MGHVQWIVWTTPLQVVVIFQTSYCNPAIVLLSPRCILRKKGQQLHSSTNPSLSELTCENSTRGVQLWGTDALKSEILGEGAGTS